MNLDAPTPAEATLVDRRFGLLTSVRPDPYPDLPAAWVGYGAAVADTRQFADWHADPFGFGAAVGDPDAFIFLRSSAKPFGPVMLIATLPMPVDPLTAPGVVADLLRQYARRPVHRR